MAFAPLALEAAGITWCGKEAMHMARKRREHTHARRRKHKGGHKSTSNSGLFGGGKSGSKKSDWTW